VTGPVIRLLFAGELLRHRELLLAVAPYTGIGHGSHEFLKELIVRLRRRNEIADRETGGTGPETAGVQYCELLREVDGIPELFIKLRDRLGVVLRSKTNHQRMPDRWLRS
jgi:hypothetical protein